MPEEAARAEGYLRSQGIAEIEACQQMKEIIDDATLQSLRAQQECSAHPERYLFGKPHPDRARQFKPFAALRGYEELVARVIAEANEPRDFAGFEESC